MLGYVFICSIYISDDTYQKFPRAKSLDPHNFFKPEIRHTYHCFILNSTKYSKTALLLIYYAIEHIKDWSKVVIAYEPVSHAHFKKWLLNFKLNLYLIYRPDVTKPFNLTYFSHARSGLLVPAKLPRPNKPKKFTCSFVSGSARTSAPMSPRARALFTEVRSVNVWSNSIPRLTRIGSSARSAPSRRTLSYRS